MAERHSIPDFEIDRPYAYEDYILTRPQEILFYLDLLRKRRSLLTVYIDEGELFFLSMILAVDESSGQMFLDPTYLAEGNANAMSAKQITLDTSLDRVKIQMRLPPLKPAKYQNTDVLSAALPTSMLRLQRREFFRLEPPLTRPLVCQFAIQEKEDAPLLTFELPLLNISGGGICLLAPAEMAKYFSQGTQFDECRLEIPSEGIILAPMRVKKIMESPNHDEMPPLHIGCEFIDLPGPKRAYIERYIARIERERKARLTGLESQTNTMHINMPATVEIDQPVE